MGSNRRLNHLYYLIAITLVGAFLRFYNLGWGDGFYFHPDEGNMARSVAQLCLKTPGVSGVLRTLPGVKGEAETYFVLRGRSFERGLPKSLKLSSSQVREALAPIVNKIITHITDLVEQTPPELVGDIMEHGIILTGGASQLRGLEKTISEATRMPVLLADDPQTCVVRGAAKVLENPALLEKVKVTGGLQ